MKIIKERIVFLYRQAKFLIDCANSFQFQLWNTSCKSRFNYISQTFCRSNVAPVTFCTAVVRSFSVFIYKREISLKRLQTAFDYQLCFWHQLEKGRAQGEIQWNEEESRKVGEKNLHVTIVQAPPHTSLFPALEITRFRPKNDSCRLIAPPERIRNTCPRIWRVWNGSSCRSAQLS